MQRISWYRLLAVVVLSTTVAGQTQAPRASAPEAKVRELATIDGMVNGYPVLLPSGRALIYTPFVDGATMNFPRVGDSTFVYDIATKRSTLLGTNMLAGSVSPQGDRLAFDRTAEDGTGSFLWTMPIDPQTGVATGAPQRVSLRAKNGVSAKFSPDGKMLTFNAGPRSDGTWDLTIVPATGGPERVLANYARAKAQSWSADGKSLYVANTDSSSEAIERVSVNGGQRETLFSLMPIDGNRVGLSTDARIAIFQVNPDRFFYRTASGIDGEIPVALPTPIDWGSGRDMTLQSMRYLTMTHVFNRRVRVLDLTTGQARDLLPGNMESNAPAWSPDGRRVAVLTGSGSHQDIAIVNADGSSPRRYPMSIHLENWGAVWEMPWSPDGRYLAFRAAAQPSGWQKVAYGPDDRSQIAVLDVDSGQARVLSTASAPIAYGRFVWRSDGKAIRVMRRTDAPSASAPSRYTVVEIPLDGPARQLRDISAEFPKAEPPFLFVSDRAVVATVTLDKTIERFLMPLDGSSSLRLPDPGIESGSRSGGTAVAGALLLIGQVDPRGEARSIKIVSTVDDSTRTLRLPFNGHHGVPHPDGKQIINVGKVAGDALWKLFLVPLDGSSTRAIGEIPRGTGGLLAPSPDGKSVAYTSEGVYTTKIFEVDFSPALQAIEKP
jgi:Tol biopolymer transport system component